MRTKLKNNSLRLSCLIFSLGILVFTTSCKSKKEASAGTMEAREKAELIDVITHNAIRYNTFSARLNVNLKPGQKNKSISAPASLRIVKDKAIQLSFQIPILNAEVFRLMVSPDSVFLIDRRNKQYLAETISDVKAIANFEFDYYNLQSLFTNYLFVAGKPGITQDDYRFMSIEQLQYNALIKSTDKQKITYTFTCDYTDRIRMTEIESKNKTSKLSWAYDEFAPMLDSQVFPMKMTMDLTLPKDQVKMDLSFSKIELEKDIPIDFRIPDKYNRITLKEAVMIIENL